MRDTSTDVVLARISAVKFALHRRLMEMLEIPRDSMTSNLEFRYEFASKVEKTIPDYPDLVQTLLNIRTGVYDTRMMLEFAYRTGALEKDDHDLLVTAYYFCGSTSSRNEMKVLLPDGTLYKFSESDLCEWERILGC